MVPPAPGDKAAVWNPERVRAASCSRVSLRGSGAMRDWTAEQRKVVLAGYLGWTLDAFDFFLMVFVLKDIAAEFGVAVGTVTWAITLTLALRPVGAFIFGRAADRFGRRPTLMVDVLLYSVLELASGFAPSLAVLLVLRALFGVAMGGEWEIGASLTMETIPERSRGLVSGLLRAGYPSGYLLASVVYGLLYHSIGWRGLFMLGVLPALLVLYIRRHVPESAAWERTRGQRVSIAATVRREWRLCLYAVILMTAFNFLSHGSQDLYPTYLQVQRHLSTGTVSIIAVAYNIGAIIGGLACGSLSERFGRRRAMVAAALLVVPALPLWAFTSTPVMIALGAFLMQLVVQGAWGVIPVHLNELSPDEARGTFPGFVYQLGNLLASANATIQAGIAEAQGNDYSLALALVVGIVAVVIAALAAFGPEAKGVRFGRAEAAEVPPPHGGSAATSAA